MRQRKMSLRMKKQILMKKTQKKKLILKIFDIEVEFQILLKSISKSYQNFTKHKKKLSRNTMKFQQNMQRIKKKRCINTLF